MHTPMRSAISYLLRCIGPAVVILLAPTASAHTPPPQYQLERPGLELTSWIGIGGGASSIDGSLGGVFDLRLGVDFTASLGSTGDVRIGPFVEAASASFASLSAVGGVELFIGAVPRTLRMFYYPGEGSLSLRLGAGWGWWREQSAPVGSLTVAYGYRCPFTLREYSEESVDEPGRRDAARYMVGVRLWANTTVGFANGGVWQLTGGIEFEPVGTFRYLFGLY